MCVDSKKFDNVNNGDANSKYDILNSFYKDKNNLYLRLKKYYCDVFDEECFNSIADKKEEELMKALGLHKTDSHLDFCENDLNSKSCSIKAKQYLHYVLLKDYLNKFESYKRIEYFYDIIIVSRILLRMEKRKNRIRFFCKKQSINCLKSFKAGLFLPFEYNEPTSIFSKLFLFVFLSLPSFFDGIILFFISILLLLLYSIKIASDESKKVLKRITGSGSVKILCRYLVGGMFKIFDKLNLTFATVISKIGDLFYKFLSSFQFALLRKSVNKNKIINFECKNKKAKKDIDVLVEKSSKTGFEKNVEEEFDRIIYYLISNDDYCGEKNNVIKFKESA